MSRIELRQEQLEAVNKMKNGCILCGNVGSGKSRTALAYYVKDTQNEPRDLYIITTAKKRDSTEWIKECQPFAINSNPETSWNNVMLKIDSWNNIKKYKDVYGSFFIFDEQRVVGWGTWAKTFLNISRKNKWILLSATPGDTWSDYMAVFIANGFYRNKTEFTTRHVIYDRYAKYQRIDKYIDQNLLRKHRDEILVTMEDKRDTKRHKIHVPVSYDIGLYRTVIKNRWDPYDNKPIEETGKLCFLMRRVVNSDQNRIIELKKILDNHPKIIVFYNFDYELMILRDFFIDNKIEFSEWNGHIHDDIPNGNKWVYLVQYTAGCEGWNCITTDTIVFYSQSYSYRQTEQAAGRIDRLNTPYKDLYYYYMRSTAAIDLAIYRSLSNKRNFNQSAFINRMTKK